MANRDSRTPAGQLPLFLGLLAAMALLLVSAGNMTMMGSSNSIEVLPASARSALGVSKGLFVPPSDYMTQIWFLWTDGWVGLPVNGTSGE